MKKLKWTLLGSLATIGIIAIVFWLYIKFEKSEGINPLSIIPNNAVYIFESDQPIKNWKQLQTNELWLFLTKHPYFNAISDDALYLNKLLDENSKLANAFGNRKFICSAHLINQNDYDFMFALDLSSANGMLSKGNLLSRILKQVGYNITIREEGNSQILACSQAKNESILYLAQIENYLVCSYSLALVRNSIKAYSDPKILQNQDFNTVFKKIKHQDFGQLYVQWSYMDDYIALYQKENSDWIKTITKSMSFGAYDLSLKENAIRIAGFANAIDSTNSYLSALMKSGNGESDIAKILSNRTAYYWSMCFDDANVLYDNLLHGLQLNPKELKSFENNRDRIEKYLNISLREDFIGWIGSEIALAQSKKFSLSDSDEYFALIKLKNKDVASSKLKELSLQIKRRTPAKFKQIYFRSYTIEYLELKGAFKLLFGNLFDKFETPYYTIIDDYVVFGNSALGIIGLIEDYENKRVLVNDANFQKPGKGNSMLAIYVAPHNTFAALTPKLKPSKASDFQQSKEYFEGFGAFTMSLTKEDDLIVFDSYLALKKDNKDSQISVGDIWNLWQQRVEYKEEKPEFELRIIEGGRYKQYYPNSDKLFIDAHVKWGIMHGKYSEYHKNGELKCKGKYRKGQRSGAWKYYNENGSLINKKRF
jgi:hypothetical protein